MPVVKTKGSASSQGFGEFAPKGGPVNYIDDVFSTYLYTAGVSGVTNNINLSTKGGMVWIKSRSSADYHNIFDTARGVLNDLRSNTTDSQVSASDTLTAFNTTGFSLGSDSSGYGVNSGGANYASWTFRKQPKFFDVVTYTGNGTYGRTVAHNLGSVPGFIVVKCTSSVQPWAVYHRSLGGTKYLNLNSTGAAITDNAYWNNTNPTSTEFTVGGDGDVNGSGKTYVAYLFAHDAGGFGTAGTDNVISCGSYTGNGSATGPTITLGYEPQWVLVKNTTSSATDWYLTDNMRGFNVTSNSSLYPNTSDAENDLFGTTKRIEPTATGFNVTAAGALNTSGNTYIYIAIRRPMKPPTTGTSVYTSASGNSGNPSFSSSFPVDFALAKSKTSALDWLDSDRLRGAKVLRPNLTDAETDYSYAKFDYMNGWNSYPIDSSYQSWMFKRASTFFDEVCYTGNGATPQNVSHNLTVAPELMIVKNRSSSASWAVYANSLGNTKFLFLDANAQAMTDSSIWASTNPTTSSFSIGGGYTNTNAFGNNYVAYLFATVAGVSKVGSYTGTGTVTQTINAGFGASGARWVLIKRTDSAGDWYVFDTARGFTSSSSPYLLLNSNAAEVTGNNGCYAASTGFTLTTNASATVNVNGASYIYLAIA